MLSRSSQTVRNRQAPLAAWPALTRVTRTSLCIFTFWPHLADRSFHARGSPNSALLSLGMSAPAREGRLPANARAAAAPPPRAVQLAAAAAAYEGETHSDEPEEVASDGEGDAEGVPRVAAGAAAAPSRVSSAPHVDGELAHALADEEPGNAAVSPVDAARCGQVAAGRALSLV